MSKPNLCVVCDKALKIGGFAYNQEVCWDCFEQKVISIAMLTRDAEDRDIVLYLLNVQKEIQKGWGIKDIKAINARSWTTRMWYCFERLLRNSRIDKDVLR